MATLTINFTPVSPTPSNGYHVSYRIKGSNASYTTVPVSGTPAVITGLPASTEFEGYIRAECVPGYYSTPSPFATCTCPATYTKNSQGICEKFDEQSPTILYTNYCLAASRRTEYGSVKSRIYNTGFSSSSIELTTPPSGDVYAEMTNSMQWRGVDANTGPMNRASVWVDSDCDGTKDAALTVGQKVTLAYAYNNPSVPRTVYVGVAADNQFQLVVNDVTIASTLNATSSNNFYIWHIFPVPIISGYNYFNVIATGDGSVEDAVAMTIYNNTPDQIVAGTDANLNILFSSSSLIGQHIDVATCSATYNLDTSGGQGNYVCRKSLTTNCGY